MATIRVADEVWIATALLHRQHPERDDFTVGEIIRRAEAEKVTGAGRLRPGVQVHAYLHCVANKAPNPGRYRMLVETAKGRGGGSSGRAIRATRCVLLARMSPMRARFRRHMANCSSGIAANTRAPMAETISIRSSPCAAWARRSGRTRTPTPTSAGCARAGVEQDFLGHEPLRVPVGRSGRAGRAGRGAAPMDDRTRGRDADLRTARLVALTLGEVLVKPMEAGDEALMRRYEHAIEAGATVLPFDQRAARRFADIRRDRSIRAPDAIQLACAAAANVDLFVTNDDRLSRKRVRGIQFIQSLDRATP